MLALANDARAIVLEAMAAVIAPPPPITPSQWGAENIVVADGPRAGEKWDPALTPYVVEPLDNMGPDSPVNKQVVRKSAQTGFTMMAQVGAGHSIACDPAGGLLVVQPTQDALDKFLRDKFNPMVEQSAALKAKVAPQVARSGEGSTAYNKRYPGGSASFVIANSAAALRSMTKKRIVKDEASEYVLDLDGQGSPHDMIEARRTTFIATADWKEANISTPTIVGECYIDAEFEKGDRRFWHVRCPGCGDWFVFRFGPHFKYRTEFPYQAYYVSPCCGTVIEHAQKNALVRAGRWTATAPAAGKFPSYHFDALSSPFVTWDYVAEKAVAAAADPSKLQGFTNLVLGEAFEVKGNAPDHKLLMQRREDYPRGRILPGCLLVTLAADVQMRGIYVEAVAWTADRRSYVIEADYLDGATTDHDDGAFARLTEYFHRTWPDAYGNRWRADEIGVDSGWRTQVVYAWTRSHPGTKALKGAEGWGRPALGVASDVDVNYRGRPFRGGAKLRSVGTWPLKGTFYAYLALEASIADSALSFPRGYCHFGAFLDENYFRQITSEYLAEDKSKGKPRKVWKQRDADNHFLDCRIMNMALADAWLSTYTTDDWARRAKERGVPDDLLTPDLFNPLARPAVETDGGKLAEAADPFARLAQINKGLS